MSGYKFTAKKVNFQGEDGFYVKQYRGEKVVVEQFIPAECFESFCKTVGVKPEMIQEVRTMFRLQVKFCGRWKWGIREYATLDAANDRVNELAKVGIIARVKLAAELFN